MFLNSVKHAVACRRHDACRRKKHAVNDFSLSLPAVYLGVTNLNTYQVRMTSLCTQWQPHRHASAYRVIIESLLSEYTVSITLYCTGVTLSSNSSNYCSACVFILISFWQ